MIDADRQRLILLTRLAWPSGLVRERTAAAIADLLLGPSQREATYAALLNWLRTQLLESVAASGLLPLALVRLHDAPFAFGAVEEAWRVLRARSLLAWLLVDDLAPDLQVPLENTLHHSGEAPPDFVVDPFFTKYVTAFLPPIYEVRAKRLERRAGLPFRRQWAYEWDGLVRRSGLERSTQPLRFWAGPKPDKSRYVAADPPMSEAYRSAYLRALAWATASGALSPHEAAWLAAETCPLDLELWRLPPTRRPGWWPRAEEPTGKIDTVTPAVWRQVSELWERQLGDAAGLFGDEWLLAQASGIVHHGTDIHDLAIFGLFHKCHGPEEPDLATIAAWCDGGGPTDSNEIAASFPSPLRFRGTVEEQPVNAWVRRFRDWSIVPAAVAVEHAPTLPRWQAWRAMRRLWLPTPCLGRSSLQFGYADGSVAVRDDVGIIACWNDWTEGLGELLADGLPFTTGQYLLVRRQVVEEFAAATGSTFCWVCRTSVYHREHSYDDYQRFTDHRALGATRLIRP